MNKISCDLAMDTDERDRWDRSSKSDKQVIAELQRKIAELEAKVAAMESSSKVPAAERDEGVNDESPVVNQPEGNTNPACISQSLMPDIRPFTANVDESRTAPKTPVSNQASSDSQAASPAGNAPSGDEPDSRPGDLEGLNQVNNAAPSVGDEEVRSAGGEETLNPSSPHPLSPHPPRRVQRPPPSPRPSTAGKIPSVRKLSIITA